MAMLAGYGIQWAGYDGAPDVLEQTPLVKRTMTTMLGGIPLACIGVGALLFSRFRLTSEEHARIRGEVEARRAAE